MHLRSSPSSLTLSASRCTAYTMVEPLPMPTTLVSLVMWLSTAAMPASCLAASTDMAGLLVAKPQMLLLLLARLLLLQLVEKLLVTAVRSLVARRLSLVGRRLPPVTSPWLASKP